VLGVFGVGGENYYSYEVLIIFNLFKLKPPLLLNKKDGA